MTHTTMITTAQANARITELAPAIREALSTAKGRLAFTLGIAEFRESVTTNPGDDLIEAYDTGRELAHVATLREHESA